MKLTLGQSIKIIALSTICLMAGVSTAAQGENVKNIVLGHGAFVGGASWCQVYDILTQDGYKVTLVQEPLTSFKEDIAGAQRVLNQQDGTVILGWATATAVRSSAKRAMIRTWRAWCISRPMCWTSARRAAVTAKNTTTARIRM